MSQTVPGQKAPLLLSGLVLATIEGVLWWQLVGPASEQAGVKAGSLFRLGSAANRKSKRIRDTVRGARVMQLEGGAEDSHKLLPHLKPGAHILIKCEDGSLHKLLLSKLGARLSLAKGTAASTASTSATAIFGVGMTADQLIGKQLPAINLYSYQGRSTGAGGSRSGLPDPKLILSTGRSLKAGPLLLNPSPQTMLAQEAI
ncbi:hypothetical protein B0T25DRAFT_569482 [Lasiosphaeria hispida]|uniref:Uncharacterized protein n=1 Tax=Lasiosphaeria hispida TaxID=260671 RepID=A0AAJ0HDJ4_9PEZI|nr:hypothetical protein B0T25DRAFT_569482 [Lasiosphaeria hispida]